MYEITASSIHDELRTVAAMMWSLSAGINSHMRSLTEAGPAGAMRTASAGALSSSSGDLPLLGACRPGGDRSNVAAETLVYAVHVLRQASR
jgi:hypothetical protein